MALFYEKQSNKPQAIKYYNRSLRAKSQDQYLMASNYRNLADIYFDTAKYQMAGNYYDSTLVRLQVRTREYNYIKKKRENLDDVIKYEDIAQKNDSILNVVALSNSDKKSFYEDYIVKLKKADIERAEKEKALAKKKASQTDSGGDDAVEAIDKKGGMASKGMSNPSENTRAVNGKLSDPMGKVGGTPPTPNPSLPSSGKKEDASNFYFYNSTMVAYGKIEYKKKWGNRVYKNNWRLSSTAKDIEEEKPDKATDNDSIVKKVEEKTSEPKYTTDFYLKQLPIDPKVIDSLGKERNFAYYQLGVIYKEKFKEYKLAASKLEQLLRNKPEERLVLPAMYNLYKIYEIIDPSKAVAMKETIISQFPTSRYAQILSNSAVGQEMQNLSPEVAYEGLFQQYEDQKYFQVLAGLEQTITQFTGDEIVPKMELLKANTIGKLKGLNEFKTALNFVALNYPSSEEGKKAEAILANDVPKMEALQFDAAKPASWKILYKISNVETPQTKEVHDKIKKFVSERTSERLISSLDIYTMTENFIVVHNIGLEQTAKDIVSIFTDYKDYKITLKAIVISNENYKIVQIKKNLETYLSPRVAPVKQAEASSQPSEKEIAGQQKPPTGKDRRARTQPNSKADPEVKNSMKEENGKATPKIVDPVNGDDEAEPSLPPTPKKKP